MNEIHSIFGFREVANFLKDNVNERAVAFLKLSPARHLSVEMKEGPGANRGTDRRNSEKTG
jgi:hypothetical protein